MVKIASFHSFTVFTVTVIKEFVYRNKVFPLFTFLFVIVIVIV